MRKFILPLAAVVALAFVATDATPAQAQVVIGGGYVAPGYYGGYYGYPYVGVGIGLGYPYYGGYYGYRPYYGGYGYRGYYGGFRGFGGGRRR